MKIKFKERDDTKYIRLLEKDCGNVSYEELYRQHRQAGDFHIDAHFYIDRLGSVSKGRDIDVVAGVGLPDNDVSVYVLINKDEKLNDLQRLSVQEVIAELQLDYPNAEIQEKEGDK